MMKLYCDVMIDIMCAFLPARIVASMSVVYESYYNL